MIHRPLSITVIGALLIGWGLLNAWGAYRTVRIVDEVSGWSNMFSRDGVLFALVVVNGIVEIVAGFGILLGKNWARALWTSWYILDLALKFSLGIGTPMIVQVIQLVFIYFLFRPDADAFFETD